MLDSKAYTNISYHDVPKLYWDKYPFKIIVKSPFTQPAKMLFSPAGTINFSSGEYNAWMSYIAAKREFYRNIRLTCPADPTWKSMNNGGADTFSFFFVNVDDAKVFIKKHHSHIVEVFRPSSEDQITALSSNNKLVLRDKLFYPTEKFKGYRHCIEFNMQFNVDDEYALDSTIRNLFLNRKNIKRYMYVYSKSRRLYLSDINDIVLVKLSDAGKKIKKYSTVLLKSEI